MSKTSELYKNIKGYIYQNKIRPGERIYLKGLSEQLGLSITPLREVLNRLVQEGLVCHDLNRGYTLKIFSINDIDMLYGFCEALETYAISLAVNNITPETLRELHENLVEYEREMVEDYSNQRFVINNQFHIKIAQLSNNEIIVEHLERALEKIIWTWKNMTIGRGPEAYKEHLMIYKALENRDAPNAVSSIRNHIRNTRKFIVKMLQFRENLFVE